MDRNTSVVSSAGTMGKSLSARRAWIEIWEVLNLDRWLAWSLSARRAWIEISGVMRQNPGKHVALRKESVDRNRILRM